MAERIFYSWQSDLPNATNRGLIEAALEAAAKVIRSDNDLSVEPVIDRDTIGIAGAPDIASAIFSKIDEAAVFVCDVSIINQGTGSRPTPNPNVLIELGYAKKALTPSRVLMVMNTAFGSPELLPFDLRMRRVITYSMPEEVHERANVRKELGKKLASGLRAVWEENPSRIPVGELINPAPASVPLIEALQTERRTQGPLARRFISSVTEQLDELAPDLTAHREDIDDLLVQAIEQTIEVVTDFSLVANEIAVVEGREAALAVYDGFGRILDHYTTPRGYSGSVRLTQFDFWKFVGYELIVCFFAPLVREKRWELIAELLDRDIYVDSHPKTGQPGGVTFDNLSETVHLLDIRNRRRELRRPSLHADIVKERHSSGKLGKMIPMVDFIDGDYFLFLRSQFNPSEGLMSRSWLPWSMMHNKHLPRFLAESERMSAAEQLLAPLGAKSVEELRTLFIQRAFVFTQMFEPRIFAHPATFLPGFVANRVGTR